MTPKPMQWKIVGSLFASLVSLGAAEIFVAPGGSDANPGTQAAPFRTLARAAAATGPGDTCYLRGGTYRECLIPAGSGTALAPIVFTAYGAETVTLTAADPITGWSLHAGSVYQAPISWDLGAGYNQVFVNGQVGVQARFPNLGTADLLHPTLAAVSADASSITMPALGQTNGFWSGAVFVGVVGSGWAWQWAEVTNSVPGKLLIGAKSGACWWSGQGKGYVTGVLNALDTEGEWHHGGNVLYLWAPGGVDPSALLVEAKRRSWCVDFNGRAHVTVRNIRCVGGSVRVWANDSRLENCEILYPSHFTAPPWSCYDARGGADMGHNGVLVRGARNVVSGCTIAWSAGTGLIVEGSDNQIIRNTIRDVDYSGTYGCGVSLNGRQTVLSWNHIYNAGRDLVQLYGSNADQIRYNDIHHAGLLCHDLGLIYVWGHNGQGTRIAYNWIHDNVEAGGAHPGVYLDNYCRNFIVDHNIIWNCGSGAALDAGIRINAPAAGHQIYNNTLFFCDDVGTHTYNQYPSYNPDPQFWTSSIYKFDNRNNLFLGANPAGQLLDYAHNDFRLKPGAGAIDAGSSISGFTDGYTGTAPDLGALEANTPTNWWPGVSGWGELPMMTNTGNLLVTSTGPSSPLYGTVANLTGLLENPSGTAWEGCFFWGTTDGGTNAASWEHFVSAATIPAAPTATFSVIVGNVPPGRACYYRAGAVTEKGLVWAGQSVSFTTTWNTFYDLAPSADATIDPVEGSANQTSGDAQNTNTNNDLTILDGGLGLGRAGSTGPDYRAFLKFDLSSLPLGSNSYSATLRLYLLDSALYGGAQIRRITGRNWTSADLAYSLGSDASSLPVGSLANSSGIAPSPGWYEMDVSSTLLGWLQGTEPNYGFALRGAEGYTLTHRGFASSRDPFGRGPQLRVSYPIRRNADDNHNSLADEWEWLHWQNLSTANPVADDDGDGRSNLFEYVAGSSPHEPDLEPLISITSEALTFAAVAARGSGYTGLDRRYTIETTSDLTTPWLPLEGGENILGDDTRVIRSISFDSSRHFYRLKVALR